MLKPLLLTLACALLLTFGPPPAAADPDAPPPSPRLGITHISLVSDATNPERYDQALALGAGWNRWPLYWNHVQTAPRIWAWAAYDRLVADDLARGLQINAILLGRPDFYQDGERITGLNEPIFDDGTDLPAAGKTLNPDNPWAVYVWQAVNRYRPGGAMAQRRGWAAGQGIRVWEVWNEPDYTPFWGGSIRDYARLLKVAYIAAKQADPDAQVMFGGLLYPTDTNWLAQVLGIFSYDPLREQFNWYMDMVAIHNYDYPWRSGWLTLYVRQTLVAYGLKRPIWLNETGVAVWDDYPGPLWTAARPAERLHAATSEQQAAFLIQSAVHAWAEGADVVMYHQLYDDCGNQPPGTTFAFHHGELCRGGAACSGEAFGMFRNPASAVCFNQHPQPSTARPVAAAFRLLARVFGAAPHDAAALRQFNNGATVAVFDYQQADKRVYVLWNRTFAPLNINLPADGGADVYTLAAERRLQPGADGSYRLTLPPAAPTSYPNLEPGDVTAIGGPPLIVVTRLGDGTPGAVLDSIAGPPAPTPTPAADGDA